MLKDRWSEEVVGRRDLMREVGGRFSFGSHPPPVWQAGPHWVVCDGGFGFGAQPRRPARTRSMRRRYFRGDDHFLKQSGSRASIDEADFDAKRTADITTNWPDHSTSVCRMRSYGAIRGDRDRTYTKFLDCAGLLFDGCEWRVVSR